MSRSSSERLFIADYSNLILLENPVATVTSADQERINEQIYGIRREFGDYMNIVRLMTSPDAGETQAAIKDKMGGQPDRSILMPFTGDGTLKDLLPAVLGNDAVVAKPKAGFADNFGRASHSGQYRSDAVGILKNSYITRTRAGACTITDKDGNVKYDSRFLDVFGIGFTGIWADGNNQPEHRAERNSRPTKLKQLKYDVKTLLPLLVDSDLLRIVRLYEENGEERKGAVESYSELSFANIGRIAMGYVRGNHMSDPKLVEFSRTYDNNHLVKRVRIIALGARLLSIGVWGNDIPDGQELRFEVLDKTKSQESGEPSDVEPGDRFHIRRTKEEVLVATTRRNP